MSVMSDTASFGSGGKSCSASMVLPTVSPGFRVRWLRTSFSFQTHTHTHTVECIPCLPSLIIRGMFLEGRRTELQETALEWVFFFFFPLSSFFSSPLSCGMLWPFSQGDGWARKGLFVPGIPAAHKSNVWKRARGPGRVRGRARAHGEVSRGATPRVGCRLRQRWRQHCSR